MGVGLNVEKFRGAAIVWYQGDESGPFRPDVAAFSGDGTGGPFFDGQHLGSSQPLLPGALERWGGIPVGQVNQLGELIVRIGGGLQRAAAAGVFGGRGDEPPTWLEVLDALLLRLFEPGGELAAFAVREVSGPRGTLMIPYVEATTDPNRHGNTYRALLQDGSMVFITPDASRGAKNQMPSSPIVRVIAGTEPAKLPSFPDGDPGATPRLPPQPLASLDVRVEELLALARQANSWSAAVTIFGPLVFRHAVSLKRTVNAIAAKLGVES